MLAADGAQKRSRNWEGEKCLFYQNTFILDELFYFFYPVSLFFLIPFFAACFLMPVVFAAYETDVIEHSWSGKETMREERFSCCFAACTLS